MRQAHKVIVSLLIFISVGSTAYAQTNASVRNAIQKLDDANKKKTPDNCTTCLASTAGVNVDTYECRHDICGQTQNYQETMQSYALQAAMVSDSTVKPVADALDNYLKKYKKDKENNIAALKEAFKNPNIKISPDMYPVVTVELFSKYQENEAIVFEMTDHGFDINKSETEKKLNALKVDPQTQMALLNIGQVFAQKIDADTLAMPPEIYLASKFPTLSESDAIQALSKQMLSQIDAISKVPAVAGTPLVHTLTAGAGKDLFQKGADGKDLTASELQEMLSQVMTISGLTGFFSPEMADATKKLPFDKINKQLNDPAFRKKALALTDVKFDERAANDLKQRCLTIAKVNYSVLPTNEGKKEFQGFIDQMKKSVMDNVTSHLSAESKRKIDEALKKDQFVMPMSPHESLNALAAEINRDSAYLQDDVSGWDKERLSQMTAISSLSADEHDLKSPFQDEQDLCDRNMAQALNDANYTGQGHIQTSWTSIQNVPYGEAVIAHEMGHTIFHTTNLSAESTSTIDNIKACMASKHHNIDPTSPVDRYSDEDFADLVSAHAADRNSACLFTLSTDQKLVETDKEKASDPHSADLFRLLAIAGEQNGSIPQSCKDYIKSIGQDVDFSKSCFPHSEKTAK